VINDLSYPFFDGSHFTLLYPLGLCRHPVLAGVGGGDERTDADGLSWPSE